MAAVNYLAIVDSSAGEGTFDLGLTLDTPAAEDVCASAAALTAGTLSGNLAGFVNDYGSASKDGVATGETGAYTNNTTAAQDVFVIVGNYHHHRGRPRG